MAGADEVRHDEAPATEQEKGREDFGEGQAGGEGPGERANGSQAAAKWGLIGSPQSGVWHLWKENHIEVDAECGEVSDGEIVFSDCIDEEQRCLDCSDISKDLQHGEPPAESGASESDTEEEVVSNEVAAGNGAEAPTEVSPNEQPNGAEGIQGLELSGASHPGVSIANSNLDKPVATDASLAPDREVSGSAEAGGVAPPVSAPDLGLSRWGCRKEGEPFHRFATPLQKWSDCKDIDRAEALTWTLNPNPLCERCAASADAAVASAAAAPSLPAIVKPPVASDTTAGPDGKGLCTKCTKATKRKLSSSIDTTEPNREQLEPLAGKYLCVDCRSEIGKKKCAGKKGDGSPCTTKPKTGSAYCGRHQSQAAVAAPAGVEAVAT